MIVVASIFWLAGTGGDLARGHTQVGLEVVVTREVAMGGGTVDTPRLAEGLKDLWQSARTGHGV